MNNSYNKLLIFINTLQVTEKWDFIFKQKNIDFIFFEFYDEFMNQLESLKIKREDYISLVEISPSTLDYKSALKTITEYHDNSFMFFYKTGVLNNKEICDILSQGAMDCINIFTDPGIIAAKITAYSKRMIMQDMKKINTISTYDNLLTIDINTLMVTVKEGAKIEHYKLTRKQISILSILILNENQPVERNRIANLAYSEKIDRITPQIIDKHIQMIKENIPEISDNIKAVYGVGYVYTVKKNCKRV